ncbi:hypothetical protein BJX64DRAFT_289712 [Aspergillus heterothallicus]
MAGFSLSNWMTFAFSFIPGPIGWRFPLAFQLVLEVASASVAFFFLYYVFFGCGFQGIPWLLPVELNSLSMRTKGVSLGVATNWAINFMVVEITPVGIQNLGWRFYVIWTVSNLVFVPVIYLFYQETASRQLEDIDLFFRENPSILVHRNPEAVSLARPTRYIELEQELVARNEMVLRQKEEECTIHGTCSDVGGCIDTAKSWCIFPKSIIRSGISYRVS